MVLINGVRTFRPMQFQPMQFQPMQFQPLPIQPFTISTACNFIRSHFQPTAISTYHTFTLLLSNRANYESLYGN